MTCWMWVMAGQVEPRTTSRKSGRRRENLKRRGIKVGEGFRGPPAGEINREGSTRYRKSLALEAGDKNKSNGTPVLRLLFHFALICLALMPAPAAEPLAVRGYYTTFMRMPTFGLTEWKEMVDCMHEDGANF